MLLTVDREVNNGFVLCSTGCITYGLDWCIYGWLLIDLEGLKVSDRLGGFGKENRFASELAELP